jgi:hypothetical protein
VKWVFDTDTLNVQLHRLLAEGDINGRHWILQRGDGEGITATRDWSLNVGQGYWNIRPGKKEEVLTYIQPCHYLRSVEANAQERTQCKWYIELLHRSIVEQVLAQSQTVNMLNRDMGSNNVSLHDDTFILK